MTYRLFISHGGADRYIAENLLLPRIEPSGAQIFLDKGEVEYGDDFRSRIIEELKQTDELFIFLTVGAIERPWVFAELGTALVNGIRIVPMRYGPSDDVL